MRRHTTDILICENHGSRVYMFHKKHEYEFEFAAKSESYTLMPLTQHIVTLLLSKEKLVGGT